MTRVAVLMAAIALSIAADAPASIKTSAGRTPVPRAMVLPPPTVNQVLARSWMGEGGRLRDQLTWNDPLSIRGDSFDTFKAERATISACQNERYNASRNNLLDGGARPLRDC
ncbi:MAG: hypothetical protein ACK56C_00590 [Alphaproteobacteria bacterium]